MRRRLVISTLAVVLVVLGAMAIPVGTIVYNAAEAQLAIQVQDEAERLADLINARIASGRQLDRGDVEQVRGTRSTVVWRPVDGSATQFWGPDAVGTQQTAVVQLVDGSELRVSTSTGRLNDRFRQQLNILLILTLGAIAAAAGLAAVQAHQLARPLERMAARAGRIGEGDFSVQPWAKTHIPEIDHIGAALDASSYRVDTMLANERHFTADATHQLRTGIAGIAMRFEILSMMSDPAVAGEAKVGLSQTDQLNSTIDELLAAARNRSSSERGVFDLGALVTDHVREWQPRFTSVRRHISVITTKPAPPVFGTKGLAGQVIDILIDNALRHGAGAVTLMLDGPSVVVIDQGPGVSSERLRTMFDGPVDPAARHGRGLSLARRLAQVDGASLEVVANRPLRIRYQLVRGDQPLAG